MQRERRGEERGGKGRGGREGWGGERRICSCSDKCSRAPGSTHLHLLGIRKQQQATGNGVGGKRERWGFQCEVPGSRGQPHHMTMGAGQWSLIVMIL